MSIQRFDKDMAIVSALDDEPNDVGGMTSAELKAKFDEGGKALKTFLNDVLIPTLEQLGVETTVQRLKDSGLKYIRLNSEGEFETSEDGNTWSRPPVPKDLIGSDVFFATYGTTTNAEILAAYEAGKAVYMKKDGEKGVYPLITIAGDRFAYFACVIYSGYFKRYMCSADNWRQDESVLLAKEPVSTAVTLSASGWDSSSNTQMVTVSGVLADETKQLITPTPAIASQAAYYEAVVLCTGQSADKLTFTAKKIPTDDLTVYVTIQEVGA